MMKNPNLKKFCESAILVALATVLSFVVIWKMPLGGAVTLLSMLPIILISCKNGLKWGIFSAFVYSIIQLFIGITVDGMLGWGLSVSALIGTIMLDYIIPFTCLGFAGMFRKRGRVGILIGSTIVIVFRFICHVLSGAIIFPVLWEGFSSPLIYSICYNGLYILPELVFTIIALFVLTKTNYIKQF